MTSTYYPPPPGNNEGGAQQQFEPLTSSSIEVQPKYSAPPLTSPPVIEGQVLHQHGLALSIAESSDRSSQVISYPPPQISPPPPSQHQLHYTQPRIHPTPQVQQAHYSPPPQQTQYTPPPQQSHHTPPLPQTQYIPPPLQNHHTPPSQQFHYTPPPPPQPSSLQAHLISRNPQSAPNQVKKHYRRQTAPNFSHHTSSQQPPQHQTCQYIDPQSQYLENPLPPSSVTESQQITPATNHIIRASTSLDDVGTFNGGSYRISHRDTNSLLTFQLAIGCPLIVKPGAMISMSPTVTLKGTIKFSMKKLISGGDLASSTFTGPGELLIAPTSLGDITYIHLAGDDQWSVGKDAFLACTQGVNKEFKRQGIGKAMFSGEGLFIFKISGHGILWISSFGAIIRKDLLDGEKYIVDNGHLVAWNTKYVLERVSSGGIISGLSSGEGLVCKFSGPGTIFMQTRNPSAFGQWLNVHATSV
ncbi:hypothetical protein K3495_g529 [Podosphaera aphanis]|nr:hypothetical protein K3495_g529 [Podosphaera aphanis]